MICYHSKNRLKIQKTVPLFQCLGKGPVLNNRSRALLTWYPSLSVGCWRTAASCEPGPGKGTGHALEHLGLSQTSQPETPRRERYFRKKEAWPGNPVCTQPSQQGSTHRKCQIRWGKTRWPSIGMQRLGYILWLPSLSLHTPKSGQVQVLTQCI